MADCFGSRFLRLGNIYNVVNLSNYRSYQPEPFFMRILEDVIKYGGPSLHQYTRSSGHPRLISILSRLYEKFLQRGVNPKDEIMTSVGGREAVYCAIQSIIKLNDEVIVIEPFREEYISVIRMAQGIPVTTKLEKVMVGVKWKWALDREHFLTLITNNTKAILFNNPNSINGKAFSFEEVVFIADICIRMNLLCISDESYEFLVHEPHSHVRIAGLPGMWERTVTIGSAGRTFLVTGWRVGWAYGSRGMISLMKSVHRNSVFGGNTIFEEAVARIFEHEFAYIDTEMSFFSKRRRELCINKEFMCDILREAFLIPIVPDAGGFLFADFSILDFLINFGEEEGPYKDIRFIRWFARTKGVLACPVTPFFSGQNKRRMQENIRLCFTGDRDNLMLAKYKLVNCLHIYTPTPDVVPYDSAV